MVTRAARSGGSQLLVGVGVGVGLLAFTLALTGTARAADGPKEATRGRSTPGGVKGGARGPGVAAAGGATSAELSLSQRRAVRGIPLDVGEESPELGELRRFEEEAFPRPGTVAPSSTAEADQVVDPPAAPPGRWLGSGDAPEPSQVPETALTAPRPVPMPDSEWLRSLTSPELPVRWDPQVLRYLDYFKNDPRGRAVMASWIRRGGRFRNLFETVLVREGLPKDLFYVAMVESGFETTARSPVGAGGLWQFMPGAARAYGLEVGYWVDARRDPEKSVEAAARYLKDLYVRFGSWPLVFAAYNAGYGAVLKSITRYNTNDYWELCRHEAGLPWESSLYVPKILAAAIVGTNLEAFGFAGIVPDPPFAFDRVNVPAGTSLATAARATNSRPEVIAALNPQIVRDRTPPDRVRYELRVPPGTASLFAESFDRSRGAGDRCETVILRFGETLEDLARARRVTVRELRRLNGVKDTSELRAGMTVLVPQKSGTAATRGVASAASPGANEAAGASSQSATDPVEAGGLDDEQVLVAVPERNFNYEGRERVFYRTRDGDTLDEIAEAVGVRTEDLVEWNNLDPTAKLHPKMVLQIFVRKDFDPTQIVLLDASRVRVVTLGSQEFLELEAARRGKKRLVIEAKAGESLARLGRRYGLTVGDLARINRFSYNTELQGGQKVVVYSPVRANPRELAQGLAPDPRRDRSGVVATRSSPPRGSDRAGSQPGPARVGVRPVAGPVAGGSSATKTPEHNLGGARAVSPPPFRTPASRDRSRVNPRANPNKVVANLSGDRRKAKEEDRGQATVTSKVNPPRPSTKKK